MLSDKLEYYFNVAIRVANKHYHEFLTIENVLHAILSDKFIVKIFKEFDVNTDEIKEELRAFLEDSNNFSTLNKAEVEELGKEQFANEHVRMIAKESGILYQPEMGLGLQRAIQQALMHNKSSGKENVEAIHLLVAIFDEKDCHGVYFLEKAGITKVKIINRIAHAEDSAINISDDLDSDPLEQDSPQKRVDFFTENLTERQKEGELDSLVGRESEIERIIQILCRKTKNNPLLVGDPGVGKTSVIRGVVEYFSKDNLPISLQNRVIRQIDINKIVAGAKFRGELEERFAMLVNEIKKEQKGGKKTILFIDDIHTLMNLGQAGSGLDTANLLRPILSSNDMNCIGVTTYDEFRKIIEKNQTLVRRFQKVEVKEPSKEETFKILTGISEKLEEHHGVKYSSAVLKAVVDLADKYIFERKLPDKAIDVMDEAGAKVQLDSVHRKRVNVSIKDIEDIVSKIAHIPRQSVGVQEKKKLKDLAENLKLQIFGQELAIKTVTKSILMAKSGLHEHVKPIASFLFAGPTGVGKTELANQLALQMGINVLRIDMSEYMEKHSVSKLIGAPPGYVGYEQGGKLTEKINQSPHTVLLLDEIEKAHVDVYNILLQVMDHGKLTDSNGRTVDFRNVIIIMTTNAGAKDLHSDIIGMGDTLDAIKHGKQENILKNFFAPEFRNRLDAIVYFNKLTDEMVLKIVKKFIRELENQLKTKKITFEISNDALDYLAIKGRDDKLGARPLQRIVDKRIKDVLSNEILFGKLENGGKVFINLKDKELIFSYK